MQTQRSLSNADLSMAQWMRSAERSWVEEDRAQNQQILRACAVWIIAILSAVFLTVIMAADAFAATTAPLAVGDGGWAAMAVVSIALVAAASLTAYMIRDTAQRVPARKRRSTLPPV